MAKVLVMGNREIDDYEIVKEVLDNSEVEITELISGESKGVETLAEDWADLNDIPIKRYPARWKATKVKGAEVKKNKFGKEYNKNAFWQALERRASYADCALVIGNIGKKAKSILEHYQLDIYEPEIEEEYEYHF